MKNAKEAETLISIMLGLILIFWLTGYSPLLVISFIIGLSGLMIPAVMHAVHWFWMKLSLVMSFISGRVLLTLIFVIVLIPLALLARIFGKRVIHFKPRQTTYFTERNHIFIKDDLENVW